MCSGKVVAPFHRTGAAPGGPQMSESSDISMDGIIVGKNREKVNQKEKTTEKGPFRAPGRGSERPGDTWLAAAGIDCYDGARRLVTVSRSREAPPARRRQ